MDGWTDWLLYLLTYSAHPYVSNFRRRRGWAVSAGRWKSLQNSCIDEASLKWRKLLCFSLTDMVCIISLTIPKEGHGHPRIPLSFLATALGGQTPPFYCNQLPFQYKYCAIKPIWSKQCLFLLLYLSTYFCRLNLLLLHKYLWREWTYYQI